MLNTSLWQSLAGRGRAGVEAAAGWFGAKPAEIAMQRLKADAIPRANKLRVPQAEASQRILCGHRKASPGGIEVKYRVLTVEGSEYRYLPDLFDRDEDAAAAGRSWCLAWDEQHKNASPDHGAAYDVEPVWQRIPGFRNP